MNFKTGWSRIGDGNTLSCYACKQYLPRDCFGNEKRPPHFKKSICKKCGYEKHRKYLKANPEKVKKYRTKHHESTLKSKREIAKRERETLDDNYIRRLLARYSDRAESEFSKAEIKLRRKKIRLYREGKIKRAEQINENNEIINNQKRIDVPECCFDCGAIMPDHIRYKNREINNPKYGLCKKCIKEKVTTPPRWKERLNKDGLLLCKNCLDYLSIGSFYKKNKIPYSICKACFLKKDAIKFKKEVDKISDVYIKKLIIKHGDKKIDIGNITAEEIEVKRKHILRCREIGGIPWYKSEIKVRNTLERIFPGFKFPSRRPAWNLNPLTGNRMEIDCYNNKLRIAVEYNGKQHYENVKNFHKQKNEFKAQQKRDIAKQLNCEAKDVKLIVVPYWIDDYENFLRDSLK